MKRLTFALIALLALPALAEPEPTPQVFTVVVSPTPTPRPVYKPLEDLPSYDLPKEDVEILAKLLWSSPLYSSSEKSKLLWVVFNRVDHGYPFGTTIKGCVTKNEFSFYDRKARISDKNRDLVEQEMTRWYAMKDGYGIGRKPPKNAVYCRFTGEYNRHIELLSETTGKALAW